MISGTTENLNGLDECGFVCIAVGDNGTVLRSWDGITWTTRTSGTTSNLLAVGADLSQYDVIVAVGEGGTIIRSDDFDWGDTFAPVTSGTSTDLQGVEFSPFSYFLAVGYGSTTLWSTDNGITWTELTGTDPAPSSRGDFDAVFGPFGDRQYLYILSNDGRVHFTFNFLDPDPATGTAGTPDADLNGGDTDTNAIEIIVGENGKMYRNDSLSPYDGWEEIILSFPDAIIGGEIIPLETIPLLLSGTQSFSWMLPVVLSITGIGLFVVKRRN